MSQQKENRRVSSQAKKRSVAPARKRASAGVNGLNRREVASISGTALSAVDKAIEQGVLRRYRVKNQTLIEPEGVVVMAVLASAKIELPVKVKQQLRQWVTQAKPHTKKTVQEFAVTPAVAIRCPPEVRRRARAAEEYLRLRERWIESDPSILGGEAVIAGSRITARGVARRIEMGDTIEMLIEEYPHIPRKAFEVAVRYAEAHPRRGRPVKPWRTRRKHTATSRV
jgi:uncharacterized protein (DUF433 family)